MYQSLLFLHWKQIRHVLALLVVASFALPLSGFSIPMKVRIVVVFPEPLGPRKP